MPQKALIQKIKDVSRVTEKGCLYVCPTPIGNLEDITLRVLRILKEVDLIAAEDTRQTIKLLNHYDISNTLTSYHEHNKMKKGPRIQELIEQGQKVALVSDAGMPGISDPGEELIYGCIQAGIEVVVLPGASAAITALVGSGMPTGRFVFEGFLSRKKKERRAQIEAFKYEERTLILYEAPHRLESTLTDLMKNLGDIEVMIGRELTKKFEEKLRGKISDLLIQFDETSPRGEMVLIFEGLGHQREAQQNWSEWTLEEHVIWFMNEGLNKKDAIKKVAKLRGLPKQEVYKKAIDL